MRKHFTSKQPFESFYLGFDFDSDLDGEAIETATVTCSVGDDDVTEDALDVDKQMTSGSTVYVWFRSALDLQDHHLTCRVTGAEGAKYEMDGYITVVEG